MQQAAVHWLEEGTNEHQIQIPLWHHKWFEREHVNQIYNKPHHKRLFKQGRLVWQTQKGQKGNK